MTDRPATVPLLDITVPRTLDEWVARFSQPQWRGAYLEGWLFEGVTARRAAEQVLAAAGVHARLRSAYKPLVHHFLEEVDIELGSIAQALVRCPAPATGSPRRFHLEAYPLAAMLPPGALQWDSSSTDDGSYAVTLTLRSGEVHQARVLAPNRVHTDCIGEPQQSPTGWLRAGTRAGASDLLDSPADTDYEQVFAHVLRTVGQHPWPKSEPYFERLDIRIDLHGFEQPLPALDESISTYEALHEDLYFCLLEMFQQHSGRPTGDRRLQPGQIVPDVRPAQASSSTNRLRIAMRDFDTAAQDECAWHDTTAGQTFDAMGMAPPPARVADAMAQWPGQRFTALSRQGRTVHGLYRPGDDAPVFLSAGQHANETSGVVGALRAAQVLAQRPGAHFAFVPLENPDGYALHRELCAQHARHMHHAARYSALGDDIAYRETAPLYEREARQQALALSGAGLHINLHGYPAHEWTRPLSGYVPRGFEQWMLPKGFFLILRYHAGWLEQGRALLEEVTAALVHVAGLPEYNARQMALYEHHAGAIPFEVLHGTACMQSESTGDAPVTLITEFPDETIDGDAFRFAHTVQMATVLAAEQAWQRIMGRTAS
ncbi:MAG: peptidase M14 [Comamonadaceae bacterium]|nr:MAG: peptidase M14 [Comamonadaceae bacterium]